MIVSAAARITVSGVLSSCDALATKSERTASRRRISVTSHEEHHRTSPGPHLGADLQLAPAHLHLQATLGPNDRRLQEVAQDRIAHDRPDRREGRHLAQAEQFPRGRVDAEDPGVAGQRHQSLRHLVHELRELVTFPRHPRHLLLELRPDPVGRRSQPGQLRHTGQLDPRTGGLPRRQPHEQPSDLAERSGDHAHRPVGQDEEDQSACQHGGSHQVRDPGSRILHRADGVAKTDHHRLSVPVEAGRAEEVALSVQRAGPPRRGVDAQQRPLHLAAPAPVRQGIQRGRAKIRIGQQRHLPVEHAHPVPGGQGQDLGHAVEGQAAGSAQLLGAQTRGRAEAPLSLVVHGFRRRPARRHPGRRRNHDHRPGAQGPRRRTKRNPHCGCRERCPRAAMAPGVKRPAPPPPLARYPSPHPRSACGPPSWPGRRSAGTVRRRPGRTPAAPAST